MTAEINITYSTANKIIKSIPWTDKSIEKAIISLNPNLNASNNPTADKIDVIVPNVAVTISFPIRIELLETDVESNGSNVPRSFSPAPKSVAIGTIPEPEYPMIIIGINIPSIINDTLSASLSLACSL